MPLQVIGVGLGRTGTNSLKIALNALGAGPCHHMKEVVLDMAAQAPLWIDALRGKPDWEAIFKGYQSAVDWPTAAFYKELHALCPSAKFILTHRSPESWAESFSETIYQVISEKGSIPEKRRVWHEMVAGVVARSGFPEGFDRAALARAFIAHNDAVKAAIPSRQLLVFDVREGWDPLCAFLGVPVPDDAFPRTNDRVQFGERSQARK